MKCACVEAFPEPPQRIWSPPSYSGTTSERERPRVSSPQITGSRMESARSASGNLNEAMRQVLAQLEIISGQVARIDAAQGKVHASIGEVQRDMAFLVPNSSSLPSHGWRPLVHEEKNREATAPLVSFSPPAGDAPDLLGDGPRPAMRPSLTVSGLSQVANKRNIKKKRTLNLFGDPSKSNVGMGSGSVLQEVSHVSSISSAGFQRLEYLMKMADAQQDIEAENANERESMKKNKSSLVILKADSPQDSERIALVFDTVMAVVICVNALVIAFSCDYSDVWSGWYVVDICFVAFYLVEQALKLSVFGFRWLFIEGSKSRRSNVFDVILTTLDVVQVCWILTNRSANSSDNTAASSALRLIRLLRLTRILRVFRIAYFRDMMTMINGMLGGIQTLGWSMILVLMPVYFVAMICRETLGRREKEDVSYYFESVPRSMFTIFRCSFGDCSTAGGMPVFELVHEIWGWPFSIFYSVFIFSVTIGLFNVISAIFVENVISASTMNELRQKHQRLADESLLASRVEKLIRCVLEQMGKSTGQRLSQEMDMFQGLEVSTDVFDEVIQNPVAIQALDDLDICKEDHDSLFDILDSDNSGGMLLEELLAGLEKLRGEPRRSDIVCVDLMLRSIQQNVNQILVKLEGGDASLPVQRQAS